MEIIITKNNVYQYAMALTARAATAGDAFTQTTITEDNFPMLDVYLSEAAPLVEGELRKKLSQSNAADMILNESSIIIQIKEQKNADTSVYNLIESGIRLFAAYYLASRWLQTSPASSLAEVYGATAATHMKTATDALVQKDKTIVPDTEYGTRVTDITDMSKGAVNDTEYGTRVTDITDMSKGAVNNTEYSRREKDNVMARPGMRIAEGEIITVRSKECCFQQDPAITRTDEHLISKQ